MNDKQESKEGQILLEASLDSTPKKDAEIVEYTKSGKRITEGKRRSMQNIIPFKKGQSGNLNGRPEGRKNFKTLFYEALQVVANEMVDKDGNPVDAEKVHIDLIVSGIKRAKGDFRFFSDLMDRVHDKPVQRTREEGNVSPSVVVLSPERKQEIYQVARLHNGETRSDRIDGGGNEGREN